MNVLQKRFGLPLTTALAPDALERLAPGTCLEALGGLVQGIDVVDRADAGGWWDWLSPFSLLTGLAVATGYALLGASWLVMKLEGDVHDRMRRAAQPLGLATLAFLARVSVFTPFQDQVFFERWFSGGSLIYSVAVPMLVLLCAAGLWKDLRGGGDRLPFFSALGFFVLGFIGISFYPMISRRPSVFAATAIMAATGTMRPPWRTFR